MPSPSPPTKTRPAGIYIHIPYCRQVCYYCDFHFSLNFRDKEAMIAAMEQEMTLRKDYLKGTGTGVIIETLYFGGGTPSAMALADLQRLLQKTRFLFPVAPGAEITLEANPDDLSPAYLEGLLALGINRLSIGVQSFHDRELSTMNRRHNAREAVRAVEESLRGGFENLNLDLIYGLPDSTPESWAASLDTALALSPPHLSCYHLSFEPKTAFAALEKKQKLRGPPEETSLAQYQILRDRMRARGYEHYEISNFARPGWRSRHNSTYWTGLPYLGIGPGAHSFDGTARQWNVAHNREYREAIVSGRDAYGREVLSAKDKFHEYLLTRLRTREGIDCRYLQENFPAYYPGLRRRLARYLGTHALEASGDGYRLTEEGMFRSDGIIGDLFLDDAE